VGYELVLFTRWKLHIGTKICDLEMHNGCHCVLFHRQLCHIHWS